MAKNVSKVGKKHKPLSIVFLAVGLLIVFIIIYLVLNYLVTFKTAKGCNIRGGLEVCATTDKTNYTSDETVAVTTTIKNVALGTFRMSFSCTDTDPGIYVDDKYYNSKSICGDAITDVEIKPRETIRYKQTVAANNLNKKTTSVYTEWVGHRSNKVLISVLAASPSVQAAKEAACLSGKTSSFCTVVHVIIKEGYYSKDVTKCEDIDAYFSALHIKHDDRLPYGCGSGIVSYYVPTSQLDYYVSELKKSPEVQYAEI